MLRARNPAATRWPILAAVALAAAACASSATRPAPADEWQAAMRAVDASFRVVDGELRKRSLGDLEAVATNARTAAEHVQRGYGDLERRDVEGFAGQARACEAWLLAIALEADQGHGEIARNLLGDAKLCTECHDCTGTRPR